MGRLRFLYPVTRFTIDILQWRIQVFGCIIISLLSFLIVPGGLETPIRVNRHWFADVATERTVYKCIGAGLCVQQTGQFDFVRYVLRRHNKNRNPGPYWPTLHLAMGPYRPPLFISWLTSKRCDGLYLHVHTCILRRWYWYVQERFAVWIHSFIGPTKITGMNKFG